MSTKNDSMMTDYSEILAQKYGVPGTPERQQFDDEAYAFITAQLLQEARKVTKTTQAELARRTCTSKSYISRVEHGDIQPSVGKFWSMMNAMGLRIDIVDPLGQSVL